MYLLLIVFTLACDRGKPTYQSDPDAVRDLLIDRISWKHKAVPNRPDVRLNEHQFSITNTSSQHRYRRIQVRFDYYDEKYQLISTKKWLIPQLIEASTAVAIPPIQAGPAHPLAQSATVRIEQAVAD